MKSFPIQNLIKNAQPINRLNYVMFYNKHNTLFDLCMAQLPNITIVDHSNDERIYYTSYDSFIGNNLMDHSKDLSSIKLYHLIDAVFCHEPLSSQFKKEDRFLLFDILKNSKLIAMNDTAEQYLKSIGQQTETMSYGVPEVPLNREPRKPILVLNLKNNNQTTNLYNYIKQHIPECDILNSIPSTTNIYQMLFKLNNYSIVIDLDSDINNLCSILSGCISITNLQTKYPNSVNVSSFENIVSIIKKNLEDYSLDKIVDNIDLIRSKYSFDSFNTNLMNLLENKIWRPFK